jgi:hypothetical protein
MMWSVERQEKSLVSTDYIIVLGDSPNIGARFESRHNRH